MPQPALGYITIKNIVTHLISIYSSRRITLRYLLFFALRPVKNRSPLSRASFIASDCFQTDRILHIFSVPYDEDKPAYFVSFKSRGEYILTEQTDRQAGRQVRRCALVDARADSDHRLTGKQCERQQQLQPAYFHSAQFNNFLEGIGRPQCVDRIRQSTRRSRSRSIVASANLQYLSRLTRTQ